MGQTTILIQLVIPHQGINIMAILIEGKLLFNYRPNLNFKFCRTNYSTIWYNGEFALSSDALKNGEITIKNSPKFEANLEVKSPYCDEKQIEENDNQIELELFGPKPKFVNDNCGAETVNMFYRMIFYLYSYIILISIHFKWIPCNYHIFV